MSYIEQRNRMKLEGKQPVEKKRYKIPTKSAKKIAEEKRERANRADGETPIEKWFKARRREMTGHCKCGCGNLSSKNDDKYFRHSICHILPKAVFESVALHPINFVELSFWDGCHTNFDQMGVDRWPNMACWDQIKAKVLAMEPLLTQEEKATKFFTKIKTLINAIH